MVELRKTQADRLLRKNLLIFFTEPHLRYVTDSLFIKMSFSVDVCVCLWSTESYNIMILGSCRVAFMYN